MTYLEFVDVIEQNLIETLGEEVCIERYSAIKNNGFKRIGLVLKRTDLLMAPTIYLEEFFRKYLEGAEVKELVDSIIRLYHQVKTERRFPYEDAFDFEKIKDKIVFKVVGIEKNEEVLREIPFEAFLDLAVLPYVRLEDEAFGVATLQIRYQHLKIWGVSRKEVFEAANMNTPRLVPFELEKLTDYLYVLSNISRNLGASVILYPEMLENAYRVIGEAYYVLPSSIHEVILIPESFGVSDRHLKMIVRDINETEVKEEEILSNHIYYYDAAEKRLVMK